MLGCMTEHTHPPVTIDDLDQAPRWLRHTEAAAYARVTTRTIRRWVACGFLRQAKPAGGRALIDRDSLRDFIDGGSD